MQISHHNKIANKPAGISISWIKLSLLFLTQFKVWQFILIWGCFLWHEKRPYLQNINAKFCLLHKFDCCSSVLVHLLVISILNRQSLFNTYFLIVRLSVWRLSDVVNLGNIEENSKQHIQCRWLHTLCLLLRPYRNLFYVSEVFGFNI